MPRVKANGNKIQPKTDAILLKRLESVAGREEVADALEKYATPEDPRYLTLASDLVSIDYRTSSLASLCKKRGLSYHNVMEVWRRSQHDVTLAVGLKHAPEVMNDVGIDARSRMVTCEKCDGAGRVERKKGDEVVGKRCTKCDGKGKVRKMGDKDARNTLFTAIGLGTKGQQFNQQINVGALAAEPPEATFKQARATLAAPVVEVRTDEKSD